MNDQSELAVQFSRMLRETLAESIRNGDFDEEIRNRVQKLRFGLVPMADPAIAESPVSIRASKEVSARTVVQEKVTPYLRKKDPTQAMKISAAMAAAYPDKKGGTAIGKNEADTVSVVEAAAMANVTIKAVYNALASKKLVGKKVLAPPGLARRGPHGGRVTVIPVDSVRAWANTVRR